MKFDHLERQEIELTCISPVHIGSGETLTPIEYVYDTEHQVIYFLDETKWRTYLFKQNLLDSFIRYLKKNNHTNRSSKTLWEWVRKHNLSIEQIAEMSTIMSPVEIHKDKRPKSVNNVQRVITHSDGMPYIPGSSLKGCLRTGLLAMWIAQHREAIRSYWSKAKYCNFKRDRWGTQDLEKRVFSRLEYTNSKTSEMVKSCLRGLSISDACCVEPLTHTLVLQKVDVAVKPYEIEPPNGQAIFRECIPPQTKLRFTITFDKTMMKPLGIHSITEVIQASKEYTDFILAMEEEVFGAAYENQFTEATLADMILGGGTGFQSKTVFYNLAPNVDIGRNTLAVKMAETYPKSHKHDLYDKKISPHTLKLTWANGAYYIMGLCSLQEV